MCLGTASPFENLKVTTRYYLRICPKKLIFLKTIVRFSTQHVIRIRFIRIYVDSLSVYAVNLVPKNDWVMPMLLWLFLLNKVIQRHIL